MAERDQFVRRGDHRRHGVKIDAMVGGQRNDVDRGAGHLPGDDVGMMFERREENAVVRPEIRLAPALGDEVDPLGRAADEDDLVG